MPKIVAITGGAQGIGRALAILFAKEGYAVSIVDVHKEAGFEVIKMIRQQGGQAMFLCADIADEQAAAKWIQLTIDDLGGLDVLINNAGIGVGGSMLNLSLDDFDRVLSVNLRGTFICSKYAARWMKNNGSGTILNIASTRALMSEANTEAYAASKGGILALTHAMAVSLGESGIRVNAISPGWIETRDWQFAGDAGWQQSQSYSEQAIDQQQSSPLHSMGENMQHPNTLHSAEDRKQHPVGRVGVPEDIAQACLFLADQKAGFITGQNIVIDGGMTIKMIYE